MYSLAFLSCHLRLRPRTWLPTRCLMFDVGSLVANFNGKLIPPTKIARSSCREKSRLDCLRSWLWWLRLAWLDARYAAYPASINSMFQHTKRINDKPHHLLGDAAKHMPAGTVPLRPVMPFDHFPLLHVHLYPSAAIAHRRPLVHSPRSSFHVVSLTYTDKSLQAHALGAR